MTASRRLMWTALSVAALTWAAVAVLATRMERAAVRPSAAVETAGGDSVPATAEEPAIAVASGDAIIDRDPLSIWPVGAPGEVPAAQLERGDSTLRVRLVSDVTGEPVEMSVRLWRLDVGPSETWSRGDEVRASFNVPTGGASMDRLPRGRYRLQCLDLREDAVDPPEFEVGAGVRECVLPVANRRWFRLRLRIVDEAGVALRSAVRSDFGGSTMSFAAHAPGSPSWTRPRELTTAVDVPNARGGRMPRMDISCSDGESGRTEVVAGVEAAFDLGRYFEGRDASGYESWGYVFRIEARGDVEVSADDAIGVDTTFVGVAPRLDVLLAHVTRPDGTPVDLAAAKVTAFCVASRLAWDPSPEAWRGVPVRVTIACDGFEPLKFVWTADTADRAYVLVPKKP